MKLAISQESVGWVNLVLFKCILTIEQKYYTFAVEIIFVRLIFKGSSLGLNILPNLALYPNEKPFVIFHIWSANYILSNFFHFQERKRSQWSVDSLMMNRWLWRRYRCSRFLTLHLTFDDLDHTCWSCDEMYSEWWRRWERNGQGHVIKKIDMLMVKQVQSKTIVNEYLSEKFGMESKGTFLIRINFWRLIFYQQLLP